MFLNSPPKECPGCLRESKFRFIRNYNSDQGAFSLYECLKCNMEFWMPFKNPGKEWYEAQEKYRLYPPKLYRGYHKKFLSLHPSLPAGTKVLDFGCGAGEFIAELQKRGCETWGVDSDSVDIDIAKRYYGLKNVYAMSFNDFLMKDDLPSFDIITFFEVIEHLDNPLEFIRKVRNFLKPGGSIFMSTPSRERMLADFYQWDFPPYHLSRWNKMAICKLFRRIDFEIVFLGYSDEYIHFLDLTGIFSGKFSFASLRKREKNVPCISTDFSGRNQKLDIRKSIIKECISLLRTVKHITLNVLPAGILCFLGKIGGFKNGVMVVELKHSSIKK